MTPEQIQTAVTMKVNHASLAEIGEATGFDKSHICRTFQKDEINQLIKQAQIKLIKDGLNNAIDNQIQKINASKTIVNKIVNGEELQTGAVKLAELGHDAEKQLLQSIGIHNAHTQSITLNQILIDNRSELSPAVENLLVSHLSPVGKVEGNEAIDAEYTTPPDIDK